MKKRICIHNAFICVFSLLASVTIGLTLLLGKKTIFSETENRSLSSFPTLTIDSLLSGRFFSQLSSFSTDHFPARSFLCSLSSGLEIYTGGREYNGVIVTDDNRLIARHDYSSYDVLKENLSAIDDFLMHNENATLLVAPRAIDVMRKYLPNSFPQNYGKKEYCIIHNIIPKEKLVDPLNVLIKSQSTDVWYLSDHHWSTHGAFEAYKLYCQMCALTPYGKDYFEITSVCDDFLGSSHSKILLSSAKADKIILYRHEKERNIKVYSPTTDKTTTLYDMSVLDSKDKYKIFLGGNTDVLEIRDTDSKKERMLLIKDSFANSMIPFLALHYDIDVVDLRYMNQPLSNYVTEKSYDTILILYGIDTLASDSSCKKITR